MTKEELLQEVETFLAESNMAPSRFGSMALNDREFVRRLRRIRGDEDRDITLTTANRVRDFIEAERKKVRA